MVGLSPESWGQVTATWPDREAAELVAVPERVPKKLPLYVWPVPSKLQLLSVPWTTSVTDCDALVSPGKLSIVPLQLRHCWVGAKPNGWTGAARRRDDSGTRGRQGERPCHAGDTGGVASDLGSEDGHCGASLLGLWRRDIVIVRHISSSPASLLTRHAALIFTLISPSLWASEVGGRRSEVGGLAHTDTNYEVVDSRFRVPTDATT